MTVIGNKKRNKSDRFSDWGPPPRQSLIRTWSMLWQPVPQRSSKQRRPQGATAGDSLNEGHTLPVGEVWSALRCGLNLFARKQQQNIRVHWWHFFIRIVCLFPLREPEWWWCRKDLGYSPGCLFLPPCWCDHGRAA